MAMQFSVERAALLKALSHVQSVVEKRTTIPILANVLLVTENNHLSLAATDMDMEMVDAVPASVGENGATTVPVHMLYDIVRKLPEDSSLHIQLNEAGTAPLLIHNIRRGAQAEDILFMLEVTGHYRYAG